MRLAFSGLDRNVTPTKNNQYISLQLDQQPMDPWGPENFLIQQIKKHSWPLLVKLSKYSSNYLFVKNIHLIQANILHLTVVNTYSQWHILQQRVTLIIHSFVVSDHKCVLIKYN